MIEQQFLSSLADLGLGILTLSSAGNHCPALEGGCPAIENEDGLGPQEQ